MKIILIPSIDTNRIATNSIRVVFIFKVISHEYVYTWLEFVIIDMAYPKMGIGLKLLTTSLSDIINIAPVHINSNGPTLLSVVVVL
jgi:hypothetical protein